MSKSSRTTKFAGLLNTNTLILRDKSSITQGTAITSGVTLNSQCGAIRTVSAATGAQSAQSFTVTNSDITVDSIVLANIIGYTGSTGLPHVYVDDITSGSFKTVIQNCSTSASLNGALNIGYMSL
jgi:predicted lipoprotein